MGEYEDDVAARAGAEDVVVEAPRDVSIGPHTRAAQDHRADAGHSRQRGQARSPLGSRATAKAIPGSRLLEVQGMGHDLPRDAWPQIIDAIVVNAAGHSMS